MSDLKWTRRQDQITLLNSLEEEEELDKENHTIVLPEDTKIEHVMNFITLLGACIGTTGVFSTAFLCIETTCMY